MLRLFKAGQAGPQHRIPVHKVLDVVPSGTLKPAADGLEGGRVMELPHRSGAELVLHMPFQQPGHTLPQHGIAGG